MVLTPKLATLVGLIKEIDRLLIQVKALLIEVIEDEDPHTEGISCHPNSIA